MKPRRRLQATYVQTLIYYDEPRLALLQNTKGSPIVAYPIDVNIKGCAEPFIAKLTTNNLFMQYIDQKIDLRFLFISPRGGDPYVFDWVKSDKPVYLRPAETVLDHPGDFLPDSGIFARNHTEPLVGTKVASVVRYQYLIDGRWSASDFSRFYAKLSDLYSIFSYLDEVKNATGALSRVLAETIANYPWQGGGSYLNFFKDITATARDEYPLQVSRIQYASPGEIEVKGIPESLVHIDRIVAVFDVEKEMLVETYKRLRRLLERESLLSSDQKDFSNKATAEIATKAADELLVKMEVADTETIKRACRSHMVTYSKIAMAIFRRGEDLHKFHQEGRMSIPNR